MSPRSGPLQPVTILMAEDNEDDRLLTLEAMHTARLVNDLRFVSNGVELLDYLQRRGEYADPDSAPWPGIILLDINMPMMDGLTALRRLKDDPALRRIPVVMLTTSDDQHDVLRSYDLGAASYVTKPVTFSSLVELVRTLEGYWTGIVTLPPSDEE
jgi:CheY-like chemotaxis protein